MSIRPVFDGNALSGVALSAVAHVVGGVHSGADPHITGITHDSRNVQPGDLYVAIPGFTQHGIEFVGEAIARGAVAVASDAPGIEALTVEVPSLVLHSPRVDMALAAAEIYGHPERNLTMIGVTGTNGKTTVTHLIRSLLLDAGKSVGIIGTVGTFINDEEIHSVRTTPESTDLFALLAVMRERNVEVVAMEVSSHALALGRVAGIVFDEALFTNLSQDHLDFHGTLENYFAAKATLFAPQTTRHAIICVNDEWGASLAASLTYPHVTVGTNANVCVHDVALEGDCTSFIVTDSTGTSVQCSVPLLGAFNAMNAAMALNCVVALGIDPSAAVLGLKNARQIPGRFELMASESGVRVVVDYAHTPDAVEKVLQVLRDTQPTRIIAVLGCGGDRDSAKRPVMGKVAADGSDVVFVTDDNPRSEDPASIRAAIISGIDGAGVDVYEIGDRHAAIVEAISLARPGDVVAILGKGHEVGQEIAGVVTPFDDRVIAREVLSRA